MLGGSVRSATREDRAQTRSHIPKSFRSLRDSAWQQAAHGVGIFKSAVQLDDIWMVQGLHDVDFDNEPKSER